MSVVLFLMVLAFLIAGGFLIGFLWAVFTGQFDDNDSPAHRMLDDGNTKV